MIRHRYTARQTTSRKAETERKRNRKILKGRKNQKKQRKREKY